MQTDIYILLDTAEALASNFNSVRGPWNAGLGKQTIHN